MQSILRDLAFIPSAARVLISGAFQAEFILLEPIVAAEGIPHLSGVV